MSKSTKANGQAKSEGPTKKKAKTAAKKGDAGKDARRTANPAGRQKQQVHVAVVEKESVFDDFSSMFSGCMCVLHRCLGAVD